MLITADQIGLHIWGDYVLQSDYMANKKTSNGWVCLWHVFWYMLPFWIGLHPSLVALAVMAGTHWAIDRYRLARFVCYVKNRLFAWGKQPSWEYCRVTGYYDDLDPSLSAIRDQMTRINPDWKPTPGYVSLWLLIITDNIIHITINALALKYL